MPKLRASAAPETVTAGQVSAISSFYDPGDASMHVFAVTQPGVYEMYWSNSRGPKTTGLINHL